MKKKLTALVLALSAAFTITAQAAQVSFEKAGETRAVLACFDASGKLVYSSLIESEDGKFITETPSQYDGFKKKVFLVNSGEVTEVLESAPTEAPAETDKPTETVKPKKTPAPTVTPTPSHSTSHNHPSVYEKEADSIYGMALVKEVLSDINSKEESIYSVTMFYNGREITVGVAEDLKISSAPDACAEMKGQTVNHLLPGDVVTMTANISGDAIRTVDLIMRPTAEDIATGDTDYGDDFESLFTSSGKVAGEWDYIRYGKKVPSDRYAYAFGIVAEKKGSALSLINKNASEDEVIYLDLHNDTLVYSCDVSGKKYSFDITDIGGIETTLPNNMFGRSTPFTLDSDYSYNYALARVVKGVTTELILFNNYNE